MVLLFIQSKFNVFIRYVATYMRWKHIRKSRIFHGIVVCIVVVYIQLMLYTVKIYKKLNFLIHSSFYTQFNTTNHTVSHIQCILIKTININNICFYINIYISYT